MPKCSYCNSDNAENFVMLNTWKGSGRENVTFYFCSKDCKNHIQKFSEFANNNIKKFLIFLLVDILTLILFLSLAIFFKEIKLISLAFGIPIFLLGIILFRYPFATPETTQNWGLKKSISVLKKIGMILSGIGFLVLLFNLF